MNKHWSRTVCKLNPYTPGEQPRTPGLIKLNTNENPYAPSPDVEKLLKKSINASLRLYPDPESVSLRNKLAEYYNLSTDQIFVGNGSDEVLAHIFQALLKHDLNILFPDVSYGFYRVYCDLYDIRYTEIETTDNLEINLKNYHVPNGGIVLANPNAPTGIFIPIEEIICLLDANKDSVVVIDEAYVDFGGESAVSLINNYDNLLVVQTFSKSRSLAGLRIGFAMGNPGLIEALNRVKNSFNSYPMDRLAAVAAEASLNDISYFKVTCEKIINSREMLSRELLSLGFTVLPSRTNFIFVRHKSLDVITIFNTLRENSILVRHFPVPKIQRYLRITIGTNEECNSLLSVLRKLIDRGC